MLDAKKTAEFYDSMEKVKHEAVRIAKMLRSAQYAIAFTGGYAFQIFVLFYSSLGSPFPVQNIPVWEPIYIQASFSEAISYHSNQN